MSCGMSQHAADPVTTTQEPLPAEEPHYHGHRQRLKEKFLACNGEGMAEYELLELLLFTALPRSDVKPLAKKLLAEFGNFAGVLRADIKELQRVKGAGQAVQFSAKIVQAAALKLLEQDIMAKPIVRNWQNVVDYCRARMGFEDVEQFRILFLDSKNSIIADELQQVGTINHTSIYPREVLKRSLALSATSVIMLHNHPSGDPTPSQADVDVTRQVEKALETVQIRLHDHLIVTRSDHVSLKALGLL